MPWGSPMTAKEALIFDVNDGMSVTAAAKKHGVARSCAYKLVGRYELDPVNGLEELSRRPEFSPNKIKQELVDELLALKEKHPSYGPAKLVPMLTERRGEHFMAVSTAGEILLRHGKVSRRKRRQPSPGPIEHPPFTVAGAGHSMTTDFKGQFRLGNGKLCFPLTIADPFSRFILAIVALYSTHMAPTKAAFERVFREYGIPWQFIHDNGTPFCSPVSLGGLTRLSRWWIELDIQPMRTKPGRPDQNGIHERMHRTLKDWIKRNPQSSGRSQQRSFDAFRKEFNDIRPHQSLGQKPPSTAFRPYRPFPSRLSPLVYDTNMDVRTVNANGEIKWKGTPIFASEVLIGAKVGLLQVDETLHAIYLGRTKLGYLDTLVRRVMNRRPPKEGN
jgi:transposase InsO family protein